MPESYQSELCRDLEQARKALLAVIVDAVKCEQAEGRAQYIISEWAMDKVRSAMKAIVEKN